jgi:hypothetical protein
MSKQQISRIVSIKVSRIVVANPQPYVADKIIKKLSKLNIESSQIINISEKIVNFADGYCDTL